MAGFTVNSLEDLEKAIATGARVIKYQDREFQMRSLDDQLRLRRMLRRELGLAPRGRRRLTSSYDKGLS